MTYPTIVLHLDRHPGLDDRIDEAARLAHRFGSHLVGVAAADHTLFGLGVATGFAGRAQLAHAVEESRAAAGVRARRLGERLTGRVVPVSFESAVDEGDDVGALLRLSACCDLLMLAQTDPTWQGAARARDELERIILQSAAPTLLLPVAPRASIGERMMIAWDGSHGAARAVVGALPMLRRARHVHLIRCEAGAGEGDFDTVRDWLGRHDVRIDARLEGGSADVGATLRERASSLGADLVVMGAWGTPRWAERLLGGATRGMLESSGLPLLMSH